MRYIKLALFSIITVSLSLFLIKASKSNIERHKTRLQDHSTVNNLDDE